MRSLLNPKWLYIINTIPIILLLFLFWGEYNIIKSLLDEENIILWARFALALNLLGILNFLYTSFLVLKKKEVSPYYGVAALFCYISFLYLFYYSYDEVIPFSIPQWMLPGNLNLYAGTFLMPTLAYALFILVTHFTSATKEQKAWKSFLIAVIIPVAWYIFTQLILPLRSHIDIDFNIHAGIVFFIANGLVFLFFLIRGIYILGLKRSAVWQKYQLAWKIPIAILFPILGLLVNNYGFSFDSFWGNVNIFGNFSNISFYILAGINGVFICLPNLNHVLYRLFLFISRSITFSFTFYFFVVFLPYLPLSILAIIAVGTGFLMLTPLALFILQLNELSNDFNFLKNYFSAKIIVAGSILAFLVLPVAITGTYWKDRSTLHESLDYLYNPDYSKNYNIDKSSLSKTLDVVKQHKENRRDFNFILGSQIPYLSSYFNWIVLDNLTLSDSKISTVEKIFFGESTPFQAREDTIRNEDVKISNITSSSTFDQSQKAWTSWINLEITNHSESSRLAEYATTLELPEGAWISDYYLYVGEKKEKGILAEKKSALWVFSQIRNENKDPGILYYQQGNKVFFRVFPFAKEEVRKTGIEFIHKEPISLNIEGNRVRLGDGPEQPIVGSSTKNVLYISSKEKSSLGKVQRTPYYHFILDISKKQGNLKRVVQKIENLLDKNLISRENAKISFVNTYTSTFLLNNNWKEKLSEQPFEGGFYLGRAIKTVLFHSYQEKKDSYPVMIAITDNIESAVMEKNLADFAKIASPESDLFYVLRNNGELAPHSLSSNPIFALADPVDLNFNPKVLAFPDTKNPTAYLSDNNQPEVILKKDLFEINKAEIREKNWQSALLLQGKWISQILHPETSEQEWPNLVKYSFISKIMTPMTSYIVVENEAQKAILKRKQEQVLSSKQSLDLGEDTQQMTEPGLILVSLLLGLILWFREKRKT